MTKKSSATEAAIAKALAVGIPLSPLMLRAAEVQPRSTGVSVPDMIVQTAWEGESFKFDAEITARSTPKMFAAAVRQLQDNSRLGGRPGLLVTAYLRPSQLDELAALQMSGVDLCGNGVVIVPRRLLVLRTGNPNQYRDSAPTRFAYRGTTSLVARIFLCRPRYSSLADIQQEIECRGRRISLSTISKALTRMEEDVLVNRNSQCIRLLQADSLLEKLAASYQAPRASREFQGMLQSTIPELFALSPPDVSLALSGTSSLAQYATAGRMDSTIFYTSNLDAVLDAWGKGVRESSRFADFRLLETNDPTPYFDRRVNQGIPYASPVQTYLECAVGDKRDKDAARQVRDWILRELDRWPEPA
jgi:hypothetical protein